MKIGIIGDLILSPNAHYDDLIRRKLQSTDLNIANLESPFINKAIRESSKTGGLCQLMDHCDQLKELNIKAVSLANNHMYDFGEAGLLETIRILDESDILHFGAGKNLEEASKLLHLDIEGKKIAIGGYVSRYIKPHSARANRAGTAPLIEKRIREILAESDADYKLLYNHWNQEYEDYPDPLFLDMSGRLISGCNTIIGSHPHCIQGIMDFEKKFVFHSIGNFTMPHTEYHLKSLGTFPDHCYEAYFVILHIDEKNNTSYEKVPYKIHANGEQILAMSEDEAAALEKKSQKISAPLNLEYRKYLKFYRGIKRRKFRPILRKSHLWNSFRIWYTFMILSVLRSMTSFFVRIFDFIGIRQMVRKRFAFILNRLFKL